jgi:membrane protein implicated in regulation of membrane protease activity
MEAYQVSLIIAFGLAMVELFTLSFLLLGFGVGMLGVALLQYVFDGLSVNRDVMVFALVSLLSFMVFRRLFKNKTDQKTLGEDDVNQY